MRTRAIDDDGADISGLLATALTSWSGPSPRAGQGRWQRETGPPRPTAGARLAILGIALSALALALAAAVTLAGGAELLTVRVSHVLSAPREPAPAPADATTRAQPAGAPATPVAPTAAPRQVPTPEQEHGGEDRGHGGRGGPGPRRSGSSDDGH